ncbi:MAG: metal ABC transporter solute-binding protein, Zn/Mn family [Actinomycetota bacterium]
MSSFKRTLTALLVGILALGACGDDGDDGAGTSDGTVLVVASFYPLAEAAARIGGDRVEVVNLTPAGSEPHDIELTSRQVDRLEDADLVLYVGQGFQPAVEEIAGRRGAGAVDLSEAVELKAGAAADLAEHEGEASEVDPHFWLDPKLMASAAGEVARALVEASPGDRAAFEANARTYGAELAALDEEFSTGLASCERSTIVTAHAAFFYLAERYGLAQRAIAGLSPEAEPDADRLARLADQIEEDGITTVFYEELVSPTVAEALAEEAGVTTAVLNPIEGLTERQAEAGKDYAAVMRENLAALRLALGCR